MNSSKVLTTTTTWGTESCFTKVKRQQGQKSPNPKAILKQKQTSEQSFKSKEHIWRKHFPPCIWNSRLEAETSQHSDRSSNKPLANLKAQQVILMYNSLKKQQQKTFFKSYSSGSVINSIALSLPTSLRKSFQKLFLFTDHLIQICS